jgi:hypothetical protein
MQVIVGIALHAIHAVYDRGLDGAHLSRRVKWTPCTARIVDLSALRDEK